MAKLLLSLNNESKKERKTIVLRKTKTAVFGEKLSQNNIEPQNTVSHELVSKGEYCVFT